MQFISTRMIEIPIKDVDSAGAQVSLIAPIVSFYAAAPGRLPIFVAQFRIGVGVRFCYFTRVRSYTRKGYRWEYVTINGNPRDLFT
jgi:hypothetical protein